MFKEILIVFILFFITQQSFADNRKNLIDFLNHPEENCHKIEFCCFDDNNVCTDTTYKFIKEITKDGYEIIYDDIALSFLPKKYRVQVIKILFNSKKNYIYFGFNFKNQLIFMKDSISVKSEDLEPNYHLLSFLINNPDSLNYYKGYKLSLADIEKFGLDLERANNKFALICDGWFFIRKFNNYFHFIFIKDKSNSNIYQYRFVFEKNQWIFVDRWVEDDFLCPYCTDEDEK